MTGTGTASQHSQTLREGVGNAERTARSSQAVLCALDATTGKEIWNSGRTMTSFAHATSLSSGPGQV
jgi:hypothetical protein